MAVLIRRIFVQIHRGQARLNRKDIFLYFASKANVYQNLNSKM